MIVIYLYNQLNLIINNVSIVLLMALLLQKLMVKMITLIQKFMVYLYQKIRIILKLQFTVMELNMIFIKDFIGLVYQIIIKIKEAFSIKLELI